MTYWVTLTLSVSLVFVSLSFNTTAWYTRQNDRPNLSSGIETNSSLECLSESEIATALQEMSSAQTSSEQQSIKKLLFENGNRSTRCRKQVVAALISAMDKPNLDLVRDRPSFYLWHYGTELLGDLKAAEALDLLIKHLDLNDGTPFPMNHHPALVGVIRMGSIALPKLNTALTQSPDRYMRRYAVFCISSIGGLSARQVLMQALPSESDRCVSEFIRASLNAFNNRSQPNQITSQDRTKWYSVFLCNGE